MPAKNVLIEDHEGTITITIEKGGNYGLSKSGKSYIVASTGGYMKVGDEYQLNLNLIKSAK